MVPLEADTLEQGGRAATSAAPMIGAVVAKSTGPLADEVKAHRLKVSLSRAASPGTVIKTGKTHNQLVAPGVFNADYYRMKYPDLAKNGVRTKAQAERHWIEHGIKEGRRGTPHFSPAEYRERNPDLAHAGITTNGAALQHYVNHGEAEGRFATKLDPQTFDANFYKTHNRDLKEAGLSSDAQLERHWRTNGIKEGRPGSAEFDANWYMQAYPNLKKNGIRTPAQALLHYELHGKNEGRKTSALQSNVPLSGELNMDIYQPANPNREKVPVVISLVGGGWRNAEKDHPVMQDMGHRFADQGIAMISPEYHTIPEHKYPQQLGDVSRALEYVKDHAAENNWDLGNITIMGGSAGGHLALQHAMNPRFDGNSDLPRVRNVIGLSPGTDLNADFTKDRFPENDHNPQVLDDFLPENTPEARGEASPISYVNEASNHNKRFYLAYGGEDATTPAEHQAIPFIEQMRAAGQDLTVEARPNANHGDWLHPTEPGYDPNSVQRMAQWILAGA